MTLTRRTVSRKALANGGNGQRGVCGTLFTLLLIGGVGRAQSVDGQSTRITGSVAVDLTRGSLSADVCLDDFDETGDTLTLVLNRTLSIKHVRGAIEAPLRTALERGGDAVRYTLQRDSAAIEEIRTGGRPSLCLTYTGSSPVYDVAAGDFRNDDSSSLIAFNGKAIRARGASRWYPAPVSPTTSLPEESIRFNLSVACAACEQIYINANPPQSGPTGYFTSDQPRELLLLAGALPVTQVSGSWIVGEAVQPDSIAAFHETLTQIQAAHATYLGVTPPPLPDILRVDALRAPRRGQLWGFYSNPALTLIGVTIPRFVEVLEGDSIPPQRSLYTFLAHELAHHYFGWKLGTASAQRDFFGEPFATFLELKAMRERFGEADYLRALRGLRDRVIRGPDHPPVDEATQEDLERARYGFGPLQLFALEAVIGEEPMRALFRALATAPAAEQATVDLAQMARISRSVGIPPEAWARWEQDCLRAPLEGNQCLLRLGE